MMVDTGSSSCLLRPESALAAGLKFTSRTVLVSGGKDRVVPVAGDSLVKVGQEIESGVEVIMTPLDGVRRVNSRIDGVLGQSFLGRMAVLLDFKARRIWLRDEAKAESANMDATVATPLSDGRIAVEAMAGGKSVRLVIDTGASHLVLACLMGISRTDPGLAISNGGIIGVRRLRVADLRVGTRNWKDVEARVMKMGNGAQADGLLPARWFDAIYLDLAKGVVRFRVS